MASQFGKRSPQLGLEDDDESDGEEDRDVFQEPSDDGQVEPLGKQRHPDIHSHEGRKDSRAPRRSEIPIGMIEDHPKDDDLDRLRPMLTDEKPNFLHSESDPLQYYGKTGMHLDVLGEIQSRGGKAMEATAKAAIPSPRPTKPIVSLVVALIPTSPTSIPSAPANASFIAAA